MLKKQSFQTTYEELKLPTRTNPLFKRLPDYLWGIETGILNSSWTTRKGFQTTYEELNSSRATWKKPKTRLPDYLWGIETVDPGHIEPTNYSLPDYLWGIETFLPCSQGPRVGPLPDYLWELKHAAGLEKSKGFSFQTTYEELKPSNSLPTILGDGLASRLPLRNWNLVSSKSIQCIWWLPDYLWGIETISDI